MFPALQYPGWPGWPRSWPHRWCSGPGPASTGPPWPGCATGPRPWTPGLLGTLAAWGWSVAALLATGPGDPAPGSPAALRLLRGRRHHRGPGPVRPLAGEPRPKPLSQALRRLLELGTGAAMVLRDGAEVAVPVEAVVVGDRFVVRPGQKLATDGVVTEGRSSVDRSLLTGESVPVEVGPGDEVTGPPSTRRAGWWCGRPGSGPTPRWPRSCAWSRPPRAPRPRAAAGRPGRWRVRAGGAGHRRPDPGRLAGHRPFGRRGRSRPRWPC